MIYIDYHDRINPETGLLQPSVISDNKDSPYYNRINHTLINIVLYWLGPMSEKRLTTILLVFQCLCSLVAIFVRYHLGSVFRLEGLCVCFIND